MSSRAWTEDEFARALQLHLAGWSMAEIAHAVGRSEAGTRFKFISKGYSSRKVGVDEAGTSSSPIPPQNFDVQADDLVRAEAQKLLAERERRQGLRRERQEAIEDVLEDRLIATFREALDQCDLSTTITPPAPMATDEKPGTAVLLLGDLHIGKVVNSAEIENRAAYNPAVSVARLALLEREVIHHLRSGPAVDELVVLLMGDIIEGASDHHAEREETLLLSKQFALAASLLSQLVGHLASVVPKVRVYGVVGNHGRWPGQRRMPTVGRESNFDRLVYSSIELITAAAEISNVEFDLRDSSRQLIDVKGMLVQLAHGDELRGGDYCTTGIKREVFSSVLRHAPSGRIPDLWVIGDKHVPVTFPVGTGHFITNGSLVGEDVFGQRFTPASPSQTLFWVCSRRRQKTLQADIRLDHAQLPDPLPYALSAELRNLVHTFI